VTQRPATAGDRRVRSGRLNAGLIFGLVLLLAGAQGSPQTAEKTDPPLTPAKEIIERSIQRADWMREQGLEDRLVCEHLSIKEELDDKKEVKSREEILYQVYPLDGHLYYERIAVDGKPLTEQERRQRKDEFRKELAAPASDPKKDDTELKFNDELVSRYKSRVLGVEAVNGRLAYVLAFEPKEGRLPVRRRIDHALNNSRGRIWIDQQDFGVVRVEFELSKAVRLWGGIIGKMGALQGRLEQVRVEEGVWLPQRVDLYMKGRVLFKSFHQQRELTWRDARLVPKELTSR